jgi:hypothetical protein
MNKLLTIAISVLAMVCAQAQTSLPFDVTEVTNGGNKKRPMKGRFSISVWLRLRYR